MSEEQNTESTDGEAPAQGKSPEAPKPEAPAEPDWKAEARKWEQRSKDNKAAAEELAQLKEAQKSDAERAADALKAAQSEAATAKAELLRYRVAAEHGITDADDIELFLTGTDEETLKKQASRLSERAVDSGKPRTPKPDPNQGRPGAGAATTADQFAAAVGQQLRA